MTPALSGDGREESMAEMKWYQILGKRLWLYGWCRKCHRYSWLHFRCPGWYPRICITTRST